jgi:hypothetical protein
MIAQPSPRPLIACRRLLLDGLNPSAKRPTLSRFEELLILSIEVAEVESG